MTPDQLQWVLEHNMQIRAGHRVQISDAVEAWREVVQERDHLRAILDQARHEGDCWSWDCATCGWLCLGGDEHGTDHDFTPRKCNCFKSRLESHS